MSDQAGAGDPDFRVRVDHFGSAGDAAVFTLSGELDAHAAELLERALATLDSTVEALVLDMTDVSFIDSSGLRTLIQARQLFRDEPSSVTIRGAQTSTTRLLELTGLSDYFAVGG